jgi:hypothetical protein
MKVIQALTLCNVVLTVFRGVFIKSCKFILVTDSTSDLFDLVHWRLSFSMFSKGHSQRASPGLG